MNLHIISDLHFETGRHCPRETNTHLLDIEARLRHLREAGMDLLVLAGDIDSGVRGVEWALQQAEQLDCDVVYVAGNHEYYSHELYELTLAMRKATHGTRVHYLECDSIVIGDVRILGTTLWTNYSSLPALRTDHVMCKMEEMINDHRWISIAKSSRRSTLKPEDVKRRFELSAEWLAEVLSEKYEGRTVVITHFAPHVLSAQPAYRKDIAFAYFVNDMEYLFPKVDLWLHGHTHHPVDYCVARTRVISNPVGYVKEHGFVNYNSQLLVPL